MEAAAEGAWGTVRVTYGVSVGGSRQWMEKRAH